MKMRLGFVSNSSSSSFLVGLKSKPNSKGELRDLMFGDLDGSISYYDYEMPIDKVVDRVFDDLKDSQPLATNDIIEEIDSGYFPGYPEYGNRDRKESDKVAREFIELFDATKAMKGKKIQTIYCEDAKAHPRYEEYMEKLRLILDREYKAQKQESLAAAKRYYNSIKHTFDGMEVYRLEYADDGGEALLEHGDIFERIPHVVISHH